MRRPSAPGRVVQGTGEIGLSRDAKTARLFFALWPPHEAAELLHRWALDARREAGGRVTRAETIHLTLAFLGEQPAERVGAAVAAAQTVTCRPHRLPIEQAVFWRRNRVVWTGPREAPPALAELALGLREALREAGFAVEKRPFAAHVTLLRKAHGEGTLPPLPQIDWPVTEFVLVRSALSAAGPSYAVLERFAAGD